jgi:hypothetical protein
MHPIYDIKGCNHRKTGLSDKFNKTDMLIPFKKQMRTHLKDNGLDMITYLPDMWNQMLCVIYDHSHYTLDLARTASLAQVALNDKHDITNNTTAITFLLDSLFPVLGERSSEKLEEMDNFHAIWLELIKVTSSPLWKRGSKNVGVTSCPPRNDNIMNQPMWHLMHVSKFNLDTEA